MHKLHPKIVAWIKAEYSVEPIRGQGWKSQSTYCITTAEFGILRIWCYATTPLCWCLELENERQLAALTVVNEVLHIHDKRGVFALTGDSGYFNAFPYVVGQGRWLRLG